MKTGLVAFSLLALAGCACCTPKPPKPLPADLLPPEYEKPRGYDFGGPKAAPTATPAATTTPSAPPAAPPKP